MEVISSPQAKTFLDFAITIFKNRYLIGENFVGENFCRINFSTGKIFVIFCQYRVKRLIEKVCRGKFSVTRYLKMTPFAMQIKIKERYSQLNNYFFSV